MAASKIYKCIDTPFRKKAIETLREWISRWNLNMSSCQFGTREEDFIVPDVEKRNRGVEIAKNKVTFQELRVYGNGACLYKYVYVFLLL